MRKLPAIAATLSLLALAPALAQQVTTPPAPAQPSSRLMPHGPGTPNATTPPAASRTAQPMPAGRPVNINTASTSDLDALPQIGPARAKAIIAGRPYASPLDLLTKHVLSQRVYDMIKDRITAR